MHNPQASVSLTNTHRPKASVSLTNTHSKMASVSLKNTHNQKASVSLTNTHRLQANVSLKNTYNTKASVSLTNTHSKYRKNNQHKVHRQNTIKTGLKIKRRKMTESQQKIKKNQESRLVTEHKFKIPATERAGCTKRAPNKEMRKDKHEAAHASKRAQTTRTSNRKQVTHKRKTRRTAQAGVGPAGTPARRTGPADKNPKQNKTVTTEKMWRKVQSFTEPSSKNTSEIEKLASEFYTRIKMPQNKNQQTPEEKVQTKINTHFSSQGSLSSIENSQTSTDENTSKQENIIERRSTPRDPSKTRARRRTASKKHDEKTPTQTSTPIRNTLTAIGKKLRVLIIILKKYKMTKTYFKTPMLRSIDATDLNTVTHNITTAAHVTKIKLFTENKHATEKENLEDSLHGILFDEPFNDEQQTEKTNNEQNDPPSYKPPDEDIEEFLASIRDPPATTSTENDNTIPKAGENHTEARKEAPDQQTEQELHPTTIKRKRFPVGFEIKRPKSEPQHNEQNNTTPAFNAWVRATIIEHGQLKPLSQVMYNNMFRFLQQAAKSEALYLNRPEIERIYLKFKDRGFSVAGPLPWIMPVQHVVARCKTPEQHAWVLEVMEEFQRVLQRDTNETTTMIKVVTHESGYPYARAVFIIRDPKWTQVENGQESFGTYKAQNLPRIFEELGMTEHLPEMECNKYQILTNKTFNPPINDGVRIVLDTTGYLANKLVHYNRIRKTLFCGLTEVDLKILTSENIKNVER